MKLSRAKTMLLGVSLVVASAAHATAQAHPLKQGGPAAVGVSNSADASGAPAKEDPRKFVKFSQKRTGGGIASPWVTKYISNTHKSKNIYVIVEVTSKQRFGGRKWITNEKLLIEPGDKVKVHGFNPDYYSADLLLKSAVFR